MASEKQTAADFGARLREARERRGLSLRAIADATKISVRALEALERNDISRLPGGIFSRSFVRAYALEVGLDPEQTISEFITRFPVETVTQGHPRTRAIVDELESDSRRRVWPLIGRVVIVGLLLLALLMYFGVIGRRASPSTVQPVAATGAGRSPETPGSAAQEFSVTIRASRSTSFSVASDGSAARDVALDAGSARSFAVGRELLIMPVDPAALDWSVNGSPPRGMTGPLTLNSETLRGVMVGR